MALSAGVRLFSAVFLFVILARLLGPVKFGLLMYCFTLATIATLVIEYGFSNKLLRDIGINPSQINCIIREAFQAKIVLSISVILISLLTLILVDHDPDYDNLFWLFLAACFFTSFGDFFNIAFRGIGKFNQETKIATAGAVIHFVVVMPLAIWQQNLVLIASGFVLSRLLYFVLCYRAYLKVVGELKLTFKSSAIGKIVENLKSGFPYAIDAGFTNLFYQADTILIKHYLGASSLGIYQAGMRFLNGAMQFAPVLSNVFLPAIANVSINSEDFKKLASRLNFQMLLVGSAGWTLFSFGGGYATSLIFGDNYKALDSLWPYIGLLVFVRYLAASQGILLVAAGSQAVRVWAQIICLCVLIISAPILMNSLGLVGMLVALILTLVILFVIFYGALKINNIPSGLNKWSVVVIFLVFGLFLFVKLKLF